MQGFAKCEIHLLRAKFKHVCHTPFSTEWLAWKYKYSEQFTKLCNKIPKLHTSEQHEKKTVTRWNSNRERETERRTRGKKERILHTTSDSQWIKWMKKNTQPLVEWIKKWNKGCYTRVRNFESHATPNFWAVNEENNKTGRDVTPSLYIFFLFLSFRIFIATSQKSEQVELLFFCCFIIFRFILWAPDKISSRQLHDLISLTSSHHQINGRYTAQGHNEKPYCIKKKNHKSWLINVVHIT